MKRLLTAFSALAIINLFGILGAIGWLAATQRLSTERVDAIKAILHETIPEETARLEAEAKAAAEPAETDAGEEGAAARVELPLAPPLAADHLVSLQSQESQAAEFRAQRQARESVALGHTIDEEVRRLDQQRQRFLEDQADFQAYQASLAATRGDEQFQAALSVLSQVKPDKAMAMLQEIIEGRAGAVGVGDADQLTGIDRAVAYLDELDEMIRGKVMSEFVDENPTLAADLLERLRTFGLMADASGG